MQLFGKLRVSYEGKFKLKGSSVYRVIGDYIATF